jgi:hypothetical protein
VNSGTADIGVISDTSAFGGLDATPLVREQFHIIGPAGSFPKGMEVMTLAAVAALPLLLPATEGTRAVIDRAFLKHRLRPKISFEMDSPFALLDLVRRGEGYAILAYAMAQRSIMLGELVAIPISNPPIERVLSTALPSYRLHTRLLRTVEREIAAFQRHRDKAQPSQHRAFNLSPTTHIWLARRAFVAPRCFVKPCKRLALKGCLCSTRLQCDPPAGSPTRRLSVLGFRRHPW